MFEDQQNIPYGLAHTLQVIRSTYGDDVSVDAKDKDLLKFGSRTTVGTGWEPMMTTVGTETEETFVTGNDIDTIVGASGDTNEIVIEYHTIANGQATFGVQSVTLTEDTPVSLPVPAFRVSRMYNNSTTDLLGGPVYVYEDNTGRDDDKTHLVIEQNEQQTKKASTTISSQDYWIITNFSCSVLAKTTKYAEARLETKPVTSSVWRPITQTVSCTDTTGTIQIKKEPYIIVPSNHDVRLAVRTNTSAVDVAGGFSGYLAKVIT